MNLKLHFRRLILPLLTLTASVGLASFQRDLPVPFADSQKVALFLKAAVYLSSAWLASRVLALILDQAAGKRPYPRLLKDLITAALFIIALAATGALYMGQGAIGALAGSGIVLALLGFAIRNVVADTLSGIALAMEAPFRIGDWVDIDTLALAKVIEIGWRTTRLQTPDATYIILPNSQIARHRITNFSAPKREFRSQVNITLDHVLPIDKARAIMVAALAEAKLIQQSPAPDVRVRSYEEAGICYTVRYWVPRFEQAVDCRDEVFRLIDEALRKAGSIAPYRRIQLINSPVVSAQGEAEE
ncbi:mechanosensitive ion channel family protein [Sulfitobacter sp. PS-8MA]|uniref:mechanosensitive ion channel family protein n=1 Tax=Sulfitobacter sp. PS-8MA TaxID=3237707 RepID=UPI0034C5FE3D